MKATEIIEPAYTKAEVARRYYNQLFETDHYPATLDGRDRARKRFFLDKNVDLKLLQRVIRKIWEEQNSILSNAATNQKAIG
jgi:hypothetical protein